MKRILLIGVLLCMLLPVCALAELTVEGGTGLDVVCAEAGNSVMISGTGKPVTLKGSGSLTLTLDGAQITDSAMENGEPVLKDAGIGLEGFEQVTIKIKGRNNYISWTSNVGILAACPLYFEDAGDGRLTVQGYVGGVCAKSVTVRSGRIMFIGSEETGKYGVKADQLLLQGGGMMSSCQGPNAQAVDAQIHYAKGVLVEHWNADGTTDRINCEVLENGVTCKSKYIMACKAGNAWNVKLTGSSGEMKAEENGLFTVPGGNYTLSGSTNRPVRLKGSGKLYLTLDNVDVDLGDMSPNNMPAALRIFGYDEVTIKFVGENNVRSSIGVSVSCKTTVKGEPGAKLFSEGTGDEAFVITGDIILDGGEIFANGACDVFTARGENSNITIKKGVVHVVATEKDQDSHAFYTPNNPNAKITIEDGKIDVDANGIGLGFYASSTVMIKGGALFIKSRNYTAVGSQIQYADGVVVEGRNSDSEDWKSIAKGDVYTGKQVRAKGPTSFTDVVEDESELGGKQIGKPMLQMNKGQNPDARGIDVRVEEREYPEYTDTGYMKWYEVELLDENGDPVEIKGRAKLYIPYPTGYGPDDTQMEYEIRHIKSDGEEEIFSTENGSIQRKPYGLLIEIDEFSPFELDWGEKEGGAQAGGLPETGDPSSLALWCAALALASCAALAIRRRRA